MVIANPMYDAVFKKLMENDLVVKFFIGTLLEQTIECVELMPPELNHSNLLTGFNVFRINFIATIKTDDGGLKKVVIEIQRARNHIDLIDFQLYLQRRIDNKDTVNNKKSLLPIITIYILGFKIPEIETSCFRVEQNYKDLINNTVINKKSEFLDKLTNDTFVIQVDRITDRYQTRLDKLLSVFEQSNFYDDSRVIKKFVHKPDIEEVEIITNILHNSGTDPDELKLIDIEIEAWRTICVSSENERKAFKKAFMEKDKEIAEKDKEIAELNKVLTEKNKTLFEKERIMEQLSRKLAREKHQ